MNAIRIPTIYCPFPSSINPHVEAVHAHTLAWSTQFRLIQKEAAVRRFLASRFSWLSARAYPSAALEELQTVNDWMTWLFMFDDQFDEGQVGGRPEQIRSILDEYSAIFTHPTGAGCERPAARALGDLCQRTFSQMPDAWGARFTEHFRAYFDTYVWSVSNSSLGIAPAVDTYIEKRRHSGGMTMAIDLIEFTLQRVLPDHLLASPEFRLMNRVTNDVVCWANDIVSLQKERARGDVNNLVVVLQRARHIMLQEAIDTAAEMVGAEVRLFERTERDLPDPAPELALDVGRYLSMLKGWMRGNLDWSGETQRYSHVEQAAPGYLEAIVAAPSAPGNE